MFPTHDGEAVPEERGDPAGTARLISLVFSPTLVLGVLFPLVGGLAADTLGGVAWGLFSAVFAAGLPALVVHRGVRTRRWDDHHLGRREQRVVPLLFGVGSVVAGLLLLRALGAPRVLVSLQVAVLATLVVATLITLAWKISVHVAVIALAAATLTVVGGGWWALAWAVAPAVGWSRLRLAAHTVTQVVAGALLGGGLSIAVLLLARR